MRKLHLVFVGVAIAGTAFAGIAYSQIEMAGTKCLESTDCDDPTLHVNGGRCVYMICSGGANNFAYCQDVQSDDVCEIAASSVNVDCGYGCDTWDCGEASSTGSTCSPENCDLDAEPTQNPGGITIVATCT